MVSSVTNSLNYLYAASFSEVPRTSALTPKNGLDALKRIQPELPGQVVDPTGRQPQQGRDQQGYGRFEAFDERQPNLADYVRPKPALSPADEMALFAVDMAAANNAPAIAAPPIRVQDASYVQETAQEERQQDRLAQRKQSYVAQLYAQTGDITFSSESLIRQAA